MRVLLPTPLARSFFLKKMDSLVKKPKHGDFVSPAMFCNEQKKKKTQQKRRKRKEAEKIVGNECDDPADYDTASLSLVSSEEWPLVIQTEEDRANEDELGIFEGDLWLDDIAEMGNVPQHATWVAKNPDPIESYHKGASDKSHVYIARIRSSTTTSSCFRATPGAAVPHALIRFAERLKLAYGTDGPIFWPECTADIINYTRVRHVTRDYSLSIKKIEKQIQESGRINAFLLEMSHYAAVNHATISDLVRHLDKAAADARNHPKFEEETGWFVRKNPRVTPCYIPTTWPPSDSGDRGPPYKVITYHFGHVDGVQVFLAFAKGERIYATVTPRHEGNESHVVDVGFDMFPLVVYLCNLENPFAMGPFTFPSYPANRKAGVFATYISAISPWSCSIPAPLLRDPTGFTPDEYPDYTLDYYEILPYRPREISLDRSVDTNCPAWRFGHLGIDTEYFTTRLKGAFGRLYSSKIIEGVVEAIHGYILDTSGEYGLKCEKYIARGGTRTFPISEKILEHPSIRVRDSPVVI